nr:hypothetical protein [Tanacetum cinerariifolium]
MCASYVRRSKSSSRPFILIFYLGRWHLDGMVMFLLWGEEFCHGAGEEVKGMINSIWRERFDLGICYKQGNGVRGKCLHH